MTRFRKGGSFVRFFVDGKGAAPESDEFLLKLTEQRFRTIENSASEETSIGWVSPSDPSGQDFLRDEIVSPPFVRLRMRIDRKKLPRAWLAIWLSAEIRARGGSAFGARERKDIKADIADKVLPRVLPSVQFVDVVWLPTSRTVLLFSTAQTVAAECAKLFLRTWGVRLVEADPTSLAFRTELDPDAVRRLEEAEPFRLDGSTNGESDKNGTNGKSPHRLTDRMAEAGEIAP